MSRGKFWFVGVVAAVLFVGVAWAQNPAPNDGVDPETVKTGEVVIDLSKDYTRFRVDGEVWDEHEFLGNGLKLVIHSLGRDTEHTVRLEPIYDGFEPIEFIIKPVDWKLTKINKHEKVWRVEKKAMFKPVKKPVAN